MHRGNLKTFIFYSNITIIISGFILLLLNIDNFSVIHAWASPSLPVMKYETYSSLEILYLYMLVVLAVINIISMRVDKLFRIRPFNYIFTLLVSTVFTLILFLNPHILIINPTGLPPTQLDALEVGGIISIILFANLIINNITSLWIERKL
ncbi:MAG: hypothetical protein ACFFA4_06265 [Promethearchaeota archaeon]